MSRNSFYVLQIFAFAIMGDSSDSHTTGDESPRPSPAILASTSFAAIGTLQASVSGVEAMTQPGSARGSNGTPLLAPQAAPKPLAVAGTPPVQPSPLEKLTAFQQNMSS